jgi:diguanylate cyclase (GGDEF)-like protein
LLGEGLANVAGGAVFPSGEHFPETLDEGRAFTFPASYRRRDGRLLSVECTAVPMAVRERTEGAYVLATDVTDSRRLAGLAERQAARASDLCRVAAAAEGDDSERIDAALRVVVERFDMQTGYVGEIRGTTLLVTNRVGQTVLEPGTTVELSRTNVGLMLEAQDVLSIDDLAEPAHRERIQYAGWHGYICAPLHVAGRLYGAVGFFSRAIKAFDDADRDFIRLVAALISAALERKIQESELDRLAYVDSLTALPNRADFVRLMAEHMAAGVPFALHFIDLNDFKALNDLAGHAAGDLALAEVGRRLSGLCGEREHPARLGGDEFVVVQAGDPGMLGAAAFAGRIVEALRAPYLLQERVYDLGASVGAAFFPRDGTTAESLMRAADAALYRAKAARKSEVQGAVGR